MRKNSAAVKDRCPFPGCEADSWHDGEHDFGIRPEEPTGELRVVQKLYGEGPASPFCEFHPGVWAKKLIGNQHGHGWLVCESCFDRYTRKELLALFKTVATNT